MQSWMGSFYATVASLAFAAFVNAADPVRLDGEFEDWSITPAMVDARGDATGKFDVTRLSVQQDGTTIYLRFDTSNTLNLQSGPEEDGTLRLVFALPNERTLSIDFRERQALLESKVAVNTVEWGTIGSATLPTYASDDFEARVDLGNLGVKFGDRVTLTIEGSDSLDSPIRLTIPEPSTVNESEITIPSKDRQAIRVASINTLQQGVADAKRQKLIAKLLKAVRPDVVCFNEEWEEKPFRDNVLKVLPERDSAWNLHWAKSRAIATTLPLDIVAMQCRNATAAKISTPDGAKLGVVSIHLKCCGHLGSKEDLQRINQSKELISDIEASFSDGGLISLGDYNLVGGREPVSNLNDIGLRDVMLRSLVDGSATPWRGFDPGSSFWPGRLDFALVRDVTVDRGFLLTAPDLALIEGESSEQAERASDHAMMVLDLRIDSKR